MMDQGDAQAIKFAVIQIRNAGFNTVEIAPTQFKMVAGKNAEAFLICAFGEEDRRDLRDLLKPLHTVSVHGSGLILHVPVGKEEGKEELWAPYLELLRFARDIGARLVIFHSLQPPKEESLDPEKMARHHVQFGKPPRNSPPNGTFSQVMK